MRYIEPDWMGPAIIISILLAMGVQAYIAFKYTEKFENLLPESQFVQNNKKTYELAGFIGRMMRTGCIATLLTVPDIFIRKGIANAEDINKFPTRYKRWLVGLWMIHTLLFTIIMLSNLIESITA